MEDDNTLTSETLSDKTTKSVQRENKRKERNEQDRLWAKDVNVKEDINLSDNRSSIISIKGRSNSGNSISVNALVEIARSNGILIGSSNQEKDFLISVLLQHHKGEPARSLMEGASFKSKNKSSTLPQFVTEEGTLYRVILSLTCEAGKESYMTSGAKLSRTDIDNGLGAGNCLADNLIIYLDDKHPEMEGLGYKCALFEIANIKQDICKKYDELDLVQFSSVVDYIHNRFRDAMNRNQMSGSHETFANYVGSLYWLMLLHHRVHSGSVQLRQTAFPQLPKVVTSLSSCDQTVTSTLSGNSPKNKKQKMMDTIQETNETKKRILSMMEDQKITQARAEKTDRLSTIVAKIRDAREEIADPSCDPDDKDELEFLVLSYKAESKRLRYQLQAILDDEQKVKENDVHSIEEDEIIVL